MPKANVLNLRDALEVGSILSKYDLLSLISDELLFSDFVEAFFIQVSTKDISRIVELSVEPDSFGGTSKEIMEVIPEILYINNIKSLLEFYGQVV